AGSSHASLVAFADGGPIAMLFAAAQPKRVDALVLANTSARFTVAEDYPIGVPPSAVDALVGLFETTWGTPTFVRAAWPSMADDAEFVPWATRLLRAAATPRTAAAQF